MVASSLKGYFMSTLDFPWKPLAEATRITANSNLHHKRFCCSWRRRCWWRWQGLQNSSKNHWKCGTYMDPVVAFGKWWLFFVVSHFMEHQRIIYCHLSSFIKRMKSSFSHYWMLKWRPSSFLVEGPALRASQPLFQKSKEIHHFNKWL